MDKIRLSTDKAAVLQVLGMAEDGKTHLTGNAAGDIYAGRVLAIAPMMDWINWWN